jgi:hypothetical protein
MPSNPAETPLCDILRHIDLAVEFVAGTKAPPLVPESFQTGKCEAE